MMNRRQLLTQGGITAATAVIAVGERLMPKPTPTPLKNYNNHDILTAESWNDLVDVVREIQNR